MSNAPISVEVISGGMTIRTNSGGTDFNGLRLVTNANGEVSLLGYVRDADDSSGQIRRAGGQPRKDTRT